MMNTIQEQFNEMLERGRLPYLEYEVLIDGQQEWLLVELEATDEGIAFSFDGYDLPSSFDGSIIQHSDNFYTMPYDSHGTGENDSDDLDYYLQGIADNIQEGFISSNGIWSEGEQ